MPIEKSLQAVRPLKLDTPACQARSKNETNWINSPSRLINAWADTFKSLISVKYSCLQISSLFKKCI